jgi:formylglycine-generating enzyme required for sulfatase activity
LRRWGQADELAAIDRELVGRQPGDARRWYVNGEGHTLAIVPGPADFWMGSPATEPDRFAQYEVMRRIRIPRSFAIATTEVTTEQFKRFLDANPRIKDAFPRTFGPDQAPMGYVSWFEAMQYCRWLSEKEQIPKDQMCYPPLDKINERMQLPPDFLARTGYRLPMDQEWEFGCRAGAATSRAFGGSDEMLDHYAWYARNSGLRAPRPVGLLKPNDLGLFDMYGNVGEWCQDRAPTFAHDLGRKLFDPEREGAAGLENQLRPFRGGSFSSLPPYLRSANVTDQVWWTREPRIGFRIARTQH